MWIQTQEGVVIPIKVIPRAHRNEILGWENGALKVRIHAVPDKGAANEELIKFMAEQLQVAKSTLLIISGQTSRNKRLLVRGVCDIKIP